MNEMCQPCLIGDHGCCQDCPCEYCTDAEVQRALSRRGARSIDWEARARAAEAEVERLRADNETGRVNLAHYREHIDLEAARVAAAESKVAKVAALLDSWPGYQPSDRSDYGRAVAQCREAVRATLADPADAEGTS